MFCLARRQALDRIEDRRLRACLAATVCASLGETSRSKKTVWTCSRRTSRARQAIFWRGLRFGVDSRDRDLSARNVPRGSRMPRDSRRTCGAHNARGRAVVAVESQDLGGELAARRGPAEHNAHPLDDSGEAHRVEPHVRIAGTQLQPGSTSIVRPVALRARRRPPAGSRARGRRRSARSGSRPLPSGSARCRAALLRPGSG